MANYIATDTDITSVANAIRAKGSTSASLVFPSGFVTAIENIPTGSDFDPDLASALKSQKHIYEDITTKEAFDKACLLEDLNSKEVTEIYSSSGSIYMKLVAAQTTMPSRSYRTSASTLTTLPNNYIPWTLQAVSWNSAFSRVYVDATTDKKLTAIKYNLSTATITIFSSSYVVSYRYQCSRIVTYDPYVYESFSWARNLDNDTVIIYGESALPALNPNVLWNAIRPSTIYLSAGITAIESKPVTFGGMSNLQRFYGNECNEIGARAFWLCSSLSEISFPSCTLIETQAFYRCSSLSEISFPSCTDIYGYAFENCTALESAYFLGSSVINLGSNVFSNTPITSSGYLGHFGSVYVPASLVNSYKAAANWSNISDRIVGV